MRIIQHYPILLLFFFVFQPLPTYGDDGIFKGNPIEAGNVKWKRDLDAAIKVSDKSGKPVLVLFQEIPGCIGCKDFGREVLKHPLLVEAIETEFLPVLVYNNRPGTKDEKWLRRYAEPAWNFQVIRFLDGSGKDIIPRKDKIWDVSGVASRMVKTLERSNMTVPAYLRALMLENDTLKHGKTAFSMACFWTGEYKFGQVKGVVATEAGWYDNREITLVTYHKDIVKLAELIDYASKEKCAQRIYLLPGDKIDKNKFTTKPFVFDKYSEASQSDQKKQLARWPQFRQLKNLTEMQLTKLNAFMPDDRKKALQWLSPSQLKQLQELQ